MLYSFVLGNFWLAVRKRHASGTTQDLKQNYDTYHFRFLFTFSSKETMSLRVIFEFLILAVLTSQTASLASKGPR